MLKDFEIYHGLALTRLVHASAKPVCVRPYPTADNASYVLNEEVGLYIKYSTKRLSPWRFSFSKKHQDEILEMKKRFRDVFLLLVCHRDGVVALNFGELKMILDHVHEHVEWVSASRGRGGMYSIKGSDGSLRCKIARRDYPEKLFRSSS